MEALNRIKVANYYDAQSPALDAGLWEALEEDFCNLPEWAESERNLKIEVLNAINGYQHDSMSDATFKAIQANKETIKAILKH